MAKMFEEWGIQRLHLVDLDGAKHKHIVNYHVLEEISLNTGLIIDFGGGIKSDSDIRTAFNSGAKMVTVGSIAVNDPELMLHWLSVYGSDKILLGADHKHGKISVSGWTHDSDENLIDFIRFYKTNGVRKVICTDITKDGMLNGPSFESYKQILSEIPDIHLIASGGVSCAEDLLALEEKGLPAVIVGKAIYENRIGKEDIMKFMN